MLPEAGAAGPNVPGVNVTLPPAPTVTAPPFNVSLTSTLGVVPPLAPTIGVAL